MPSASHCRFNCCQGTPRFGVGMIRGWLQSFGPIRRVVHRFGPSYCTIPPALRRRVCFQTAIPKLNRVRTFWYASRERVRPARNEHQVPPSATIGRLCGRYRLAQPFVAEIPDVWLVGQHATPFTSDGRMLLTAFRDEPRMLTLEPHPVLLEWVTGRTEGLGRSEPSLPGEVCSLVGRLDPNYFHWLVEFCGLLQGVKHYEQVVGRPVNLLVRDAAGVFVGQSLSLLGFGADRVHRSTPAVGAAR